MKNEYVSREEVISTISGDGPPEARYPSWYIDKINNLEGVSLSEAFVKATEAWLIDYQNHAARLRGRYTPYEILSWVVNDWRKEFS